MFSDVTERVSGWDHTVGYRLQQPRDRVSVRLLSEEVAINQHRTLSGLRHGHPERSEGVAAECEEWLVRACGRRMTPPALPPRLSSAAPLLMCSAPPLFVAVARTYQVLLEYSLVVVLSSSSTVRVLVLVLTSYSVQSYYY